MNEKLQIVLINLIELYIKKQSPLSSNKLKKEAHLAFSASSIRSYFQQLENIGLIKKEHSSSGSYPTIKAMQKFWQKNFSLNNFSFEKIPEEVNIYIKEKVFDNQLLKNVYNVNNKFIILEFEKDEVVYKYSNELFILFSSLKNILLDELKKYLLHINLLKEAKKLEPLYIYKEYNPKFIYLNNIKFNEQDFNYGLYFSDAFLIYKTLIKNGSYKEVFLIGDIYSDFSILSTK